MDIKHRYCGVCYKFEGEEPDNGTSRPEDTYCVKCDVKRWETTNGDDDDREAS